MIIQNRTEFRNALSLNDTLASILTEKKAS